MISRMPKTIDTVRCSFCLQQVVLEKLFVGGINGTGKTICDNCVQYVRMEMGLKPDPLKEIINNV